ERRVTRQEPDDEDEDAEADEERGASNGKTPPAVRMRLHDVQIVLAGARALGMALPASQPRAEALEVARHELDVSGALRGFLPGHPFDGVEGEQAHADLPRPCLGKIGAEGGLREERRGPCA